jgi:acylphosphatase
VTEYAVHVIISGLVQGVSYRAWAADAADRGGLSGWVRNRDNGAVEAVFSGPRVAVRAMLAACREGPPAALVERVEIVSEVPPVAGPFAIRS